MGVFVGVISDGEWGIWQQRAIHQSEKPRSANGSGPVAVSFVLGLKGMCFRVA